LKLFPLLIEEVGFIVFLGHAFLLGAFLFLLLGALHFILILHLLLSFCELQDELEEVNDVLGIAIHDLVALDVLQLHVQDLLPKEVDQRLDVLRNVFLACGPFQLRKVQLRVHHFKKVQVKLVT